MVSFRSSIRKSITLNFLWLYILISFLVLMGSILGSFVSAYSLLESDTGKYMDQIEEYYLNKEYSKINEYINEFYETTKYNIIINIYNSDGQMQEVLTNKENDIKNLPEENIISFIRYVYENLVLPIKHYSYIDDSRVDVTILIPIREQILSYESDGFSVGMNLLVPRNLWIQGTFIIAGIVVVMQIFGFLLLWICGTLKTRKLLMPIYEMNKTAKSISLKNLNLRLNVDNVKYELKDLAMTLNDMLDNLNKDFIRQKKFVSNVSHELRTPVAVIGGYANMLKRWGKENEEVLNESIEAIKNESENMRLLTENLLFLARHDNQTLNYEKECINLQTLLNEIVKDTEIIDKHHEIISQLDEDIFVSGDKMKLKQAMRIFIDNAIKFTPPMGKIYINLSKEGEEAVIAVKDTGIGIEKKDLPYIFNRFYRSDKSRNRETGGHGLGLSIARVIIKGHGGKINVRSKSGIGSEFDIILKEYNIEEV